MGPEFGLWLENDTYCLHRRAVSAACGDLPAPGAACARAAGLPSDGAKTRISRSLARICSTKVSPRVVRAAAPAAL